MDGTKQIYKILEIACDMGVIDINFEMLAKKTYSDLAFFHSFDVNDYSIAHLGAVAEMVSKRIDNHSHAEKAGHPLAG